MCIRDSLCDICVVGGVEFGRIWRRSLNQPVSVNVYDAIAQQQTNVASWCYQMNTCNIHCMQCNLVLDLSMLLKRMLATVYSHYFRCQNRSYCCLVVWGSHADNSTRQKMIFATRQSRLLTTTRQRRPNGAMGETSLLSTNGLEIARINFLQH